jgi:hypothetical protein
MKNDQARPLCSSSNRLKVRHFTQYHELVTGNYVADFLAGFEDYEKMDPANELMTDLGERGFRGQRE